MRLVAIIGLLGIPLYVIGVTTHDDAMADVGASTFILGSLIAAAMSRRKHRKQRPGSSQEIKGRRAR